MTALEQPHNGTMLPLQADEQSIEGQSGPYSGEEDRENKIVAYGADMTPSWIAALECVEDLVEQISVKDAPPSNDYRSQPVPLAVTSPRTPHETRILRSPSRAVSSRGSDSGSGSTKTTDPPHARSKPPLSTADVGEATSFDTDASCNTNVVTTFFNDLAGGEDVTIQRALALDPEMGNPSLVAHQWGSLSERKMGHASLAALCRWTMQVASQHTNIDMTHTTNRSSALVVNVPKTPRKVPGLSPKKDNAKLNSAEESGNPRQKIWRKVWRRQDEGNARSDPKDGSFPVSVDPKPVQQRNGEEKKEEPRYQLYGSEYARHLVNPKPAPATTWSTPLSSLTPLRNRRYYRKSAVVTSRVLRTIEEAHPDIRSGALLDISVTVGKQHPPKGYHRISQTASGLPFSLPKSSRNPKRTMFLNVKKEPAWDKAAQRPCVNALCLIFPDRGEFVPPGFCIVRHANTSDPANLSVDSDQPQKPSAERVYLCFRRSREGNPLTGLLPLTPQNGETIPVGFTVVERSPRNHVAHLSIFSSSADTETSSMAVADSPVFLAYRQRLATLECLRPLPLVMSVQATKGKDKMGSSPRLASYYCTGGTVVASSVGRFHILDRSTHSLLSPSSVTNRLSLIEKSRRRCETQDGGMDKDSEQAADDSVSCANVSTSYLRSDDASSVGGGSVTKKTTLGSIAEYQASIVSSCRPGDDSCAPNTSLFSSLLTIRDDANSDARMAPLLGDDPSIIAGVEALNFIPSIELRARHGSARTRLPSRAALLVPILTACYTRHGGATFVAIESLVKLLTTAKFFHDDVNSLDESEDESSTRLTLLDLSIQTVCDVATTGTEETTFSTCVDFVECALKLAQGQLSTRTIGFVVRLYLFVFYFGVSVPTISASRWPKPSWRPLSMNNSSEDELDNDFSMLLDPRDESSLEYLPGGSPQAAALAFKELISLSIVRLGKLSVADILLLSQSSGPGSSLSEGSEAPKESYSAFCGSLINSLVENAANQVERANYTQLALHQVVRSGGSELFWYDMVNACGQGLFGKDTKVGEEGRGVFTMVFAILANLVKVSSGKLRSITQTEELLPRDIASKLLSLELLLHFLEFWSDEQEALNGIGRGSSNVESLKSVDTFAFIIRRTVAPCLLWNTRASIENPKVYRRVVAILSELWCSPIHRRQCKAEFGVLVEHFALRILALGPEFHASQPCKGSPGMSAKPLLLQQVELVREIKTWFSNDPKDVIELYLNYDTDISTQISGPIQLLPGTQWKIFQRLSASLSDIAEKCGELIGQQIRENQTKIHSSSDKNTVELAEKAEEKLPKNQKAREIARSLRMASLEAISQIVKSLAVSAAVPLGPRFIDLLLSWDPNHVDFASANEGTYSFSFTKSEESTVANEKNLVLPSNPSDEEPESSLHGVKNLEQTRQDGQSPSDSQVSLIKFFEIAEEKSIKKAIDYLIACNVLTPSPRDIANFLRIRRGQLDATDLGIYISEGGTTGAEAEYWKSIRYLFVRAISVSSSCPGCDHFLRFTYRYMLFSFHPPV